MPDDVDRHSRGTTVEHSVRHQWLEQRARRYAALGEPVRLAIIDQLTLGDASPGELGSVVDLPTNLLAHHLRVLEEAGLIRRVRSEGDRRRSYVQLRWDDDWVAALLGPATVGLSDAVPRVVFVCTHNSARSQLAAAAWGRVSTIPAASAGTHPAARVHPRAVAAARRHGLRLGRARTHHLTDTVQPGDLLVAVCDNAHEELAAGPARPALDGAATGRGWLHWAVPDPVRVDTDTAFETAYTDLAHRVDRLAGALGDIGEDDGVRVNDPATAPRRSAP
ncbi:MAG TPA: helix-turn-helix domain-containing protein [Kineosporiaceae bacterium]|nr:helix-turn-helix domain-containing protein [Kineosporiaceae bacterium]